MTDNGFEMNFKTCYSEMGLPRAGFGLKTNLDQQWWLRANTLRVKLSVSVFFQSDFRNVFMCKRISRKWDVYLLNLGLILDIEVQPDKI
jgi:hypothetical protein